MMDTLKIIRLGRLKFSFMAYLLFSFYALLAVVSGASFVLDRFLLGSAIILTALVSLNYSNDYFDVDIDRYNKPTAVSGGSGILVDNPELKEFSKWFAILLMSLSMVLAVIFTILFNFPVFFLIFVVLGNLLSWYYAAPPLKLSCRGLSEISTIIGVGVMIPLAGYFAVKASVDIVFWLFDLSFILYTLAFIISVEIPDMEGDRLGHKNTLIVSKGRKFGFIIIAFSILLASLSFLLISTTNLIPPLIDLRLVTVFSLLPLTFGISGLIQKTDDRTLATKLVSQNVSAIFFFLLIVDCYFIIIACTLR